MPSKETVALAKRLLSPAFFVRSSSHWTRLAGRVLIKRLDAVLKTRTYRRVYYPGYMRPFLSDRTFTYAKGFLGSMGGHAAGAPSPAGGFSLDMRLATAELTIKGMPDWGESFADREDVFSLHRWGWLLTAAVDAPSEGLRRFGIEVMKDWFARMEGAGPHHAWESYSISERIVNALLFFYALRDYKIEGEETGAIEDGLIRSAARLLQNLEFHGELTNNHVLNNARALYMLGRLSSCEALAGAGRLIFDNETHAMITPEGFLREDSSSYQLLLLRTYLEVLWAAQKSSDDGFAKRIGDVARRMARASWELNIYDGSTGKWSFPLIGDVTPDFPPGWTEEICRSAPALGLYDPHGLKEVRRGWNIIFSKPGNSAVTEKAAPQRHDGFFSASPWYRADYGDITVIWHVNNAGSVPLYSHGHNDIFSFVLYWKGRPVFIDPGRYDYLPDGLGLYSKGAAAHNTFIVDGAEPFPATRYIHPPDFRKGAPGVSWEERPGGLRLRITHDGFGRFVKGCKASREFDVTGGSVRITDSIEGPGVHDIKSFFHLSEDVRLSGPDINREIGLTVNGLHAKFKLPPGEGFSVKVLSCVDGAEPAGWSFPAYGKAVPAKTCIVAARVALPYSASYSVDLR